MEEKKALSEFDLDDILSEFQEGEEAPAGEENAPLPEELASILGDWDTAEPPQTPAVTMDTTRMNELISQIAAETAAAAEPVTASGGDTLIRLEPVSDGAETPVCADATVRLEPVTRDATRRMEPVEEKADQAVSEDATVRMEPAAAAEARAAGEEPTIRMEELPHSAEESPNILYNPRTRLRELKKKLVAGPEKRYYALSEMGVGRLQASILANLVIVVLSILATTLFALDMIPENRLRFVIFSQVLAMLLSAFLGCSQMIEGFADLFKGRFTIHTMLGITFAACCADAVFCLSELRIPCCAVFSLEITMSLWSRYQAHAAELAQMDSLRKAVRLNALVREPDYYAGRDGILRRDGEVEEFMDNYARRSGPELVQSIYCVLALLVCIAISVYAGMTHGVSMGVQILSASLLAAVPATFFIALTRPASLLQRRLHMVGTVLCGWEGVRGLCGRLAIPLRDEDLFPANTTKLNGVKFYSDRDPDETVSYAASLIGAAGGGLAPLFRKMQESRNCTTHPVSNFRDYGSGGIGGEVCGEPVLLGTLDFLQDMGIEIPEGTMVSQAVYAAVDGDLCAVFAISYAKMRSAAAGIVSLCGSRKVMPVLTGIDFMLTDTLLRTKFGVNTRRIAFPEQGLRSELSVYSQDYETPALALATRDDLASYAYAVSGARALRSASRLGVAVHLFGGILALLIMAVVAYLGNTELLTPTHILLYQLVWMIPGLLITEWTRTV